MIRVGKVRPPAGNDNVWEFRGVEGTTPCTFLSAYYRPALMQFTIIGVEVRPEWRGNDYGFTFYKKVQRLLGAPLLGDGFFTPRGWRSLEGRIPVTNERKKPVVKSVSLVKDWDKMIAA